MSIGKQLLKKTLINGLKRCTHIFKSVLFKALLNERWPVALNNNKIKFNSSKSQRELTDIRQALFVFLIKFRTQYYELGYCLYLEMVVNCIRVNMVEQNVLTIYYFLTSNHDRSLFYHLKLWHLHK